MRPIALNASVELEPARTRRHEWGGVVWWAGALVCAVLIAIVVRTFVLQSYVIDSASMEPTLHGCAGCRDDRVLVDKLFYRMGSLRRGDVVVFHRPAGMELNVDKYLIKRVIAVGGETISARGGDLLIGGTAVREPYLAPACGGTGDFGPITVPAGKIFVMGDNRCVSVDSRDFGSINTSSVVGRAFARIWPIGRMSRL